MKAIWELLVVGVLALAFFVWRAIVRSPKLDKLFDVEKRERTAKDILDQHKEADRAAQDRERTLGRRYTSILEELEKLKKQ